MVTNQQHTPSYWHPVQHSMTRRQQLNNYHVGHKAYMVTLKIEGMTPLLSSIVPVAAAAATASPSAAGSAVTAPAVSPSVASPSTASPSAAPAAASPAVVSASLTSAIGCRIECRLSALGEAMRRAWLTLPERFHNISIKDAPDEYVIMPEHFHGIIYVTGYMQEHLSDIITLFKARVAMAYRQLLIQGTIKPVGTKPVVGTTPVGTAPVPIKPVGTDPIVGTKPVGTAPVPIKPVGTAVQWLQAYHAQDAATQQAMQQWVERQMDILYSATRCGTQGDNAPFKVTPSGKRLNQGFLFAIGYTDSLLLDGDNLEGHRQYILDNPYSRWLRSTNSLRPNRQGINTLVSLGALEGYLRQECTAYDVTPEKLKQVRDCLLFSGTPSEVHAATPSAAQVPPVSGGSHAATPSAAQVPPVSGGSHAATPSAAQVPPVSGGSHAATPSAVHPATGSKIVCHTYGNRSLLEGRVLPVVCHRKDAYRHAQQLARCLEEARKGTVFISACINPKERVIMDAIQAEGYPVVRIEDNGFPEVYHPSAERVTRCASGRLLLVTPWRFHYRAKDDSIYVAYCKTMNCIAQALCRTKDDWWMT